MKNVVNICNILWSSIYATNFCDLLQVCLSLFMACKTSQHSKGERARGLVQPPCDVYCMCAVRGGPSKALTFKASISLRGGLQARALHNTGRCVRSQTLHNEQFLFLGLCFALRRKQGRPNRSVKGSV